ncbi:hypothetical protein GGR57DRAFT_503684 [Xylariaceae sp. FL1272]|nr:hypothetical protein GGR57DRAFT_503684 [Xylariaceae sp. FL1272]
MAKYSEVESFSTHPLENPDFGRYDQNKLSGYKAVLKAFHCNSQDAEVFLRINEVKIGLRSLEGLYCQSQEHIPSPLPYPQLIPKAIFYGNSPGDTQVSPTVLIRTPSRLEWKHDYRPDYIHEYLDSVSQVLLLKTDERLYHQLAYAIQFETRDRMDMLWFPPRRVYQRSPQTGLYTPSSDACYDVDPRTRCFPEATSLELVVTHRLEHGIKEHAKAALMNYLSDVGIYAGAAKNITSKICVSRILERYPVRTPSNEKRYVLGDSPHQQSQFAFHEVVLDITCFISSSSLAPVHSVQGLNDRTNMDISTLVDNIKRHTSQELQMRNDLPRVDLRWLEMLALRVKYVDLDRTDENMRRPYAPSPYIYRQRRSNPLDVNIPSVSTYLQPMKCDEPETWFFQSQEDLQTHFTEHIHQRTKDRLFENIKSDISNYSRFRNPKTRFQRSMAVGVKNVDNRQYFAPYITVGVTVESLFEADDPLDRTFRNRLKKRLSQIQNEEPWGLMIGCRIVYTREYDNSQLSDDQPPRYVYSPLSDENNATLYCYDLTRKAFLYKKLY